MRTGYKSLGPIPRISSGGRLLKLLGIPLFAVIFGLLIVARHNLTSNAAG
jgi:hypothetical protein